MRRMSRYEYQYTLEDLLGIKLDYTAHIPGDLSGEDGLMTNAKHLGMSCLDEWVYGSCPDGLTRGSPRLTIKFLQASHHEFSAIEDSWTA